MLLSIDRSLPSSSVALFRDHTCLAAKTLPPPATRTVSLWEGLLDELLRETQSSLDQIDRFVVGLGPGSFSGIRSSLAFLKGLALPQNNPIIGLPSAYAFAHHAFRKYPDAQHLFVLGDARRDTLWLAEFSRNSAPSPILCLPTAQAIERLHAHPNALLLSPDHLRLAALPLPLQPIPSPDDPPIAQSLAEVALSSPHLAISPPLPLYLHPAVQTKP